MWANAYKEVLWVPTCGGHCMLFSYSTCQNIYMNAYISPLEAKIVWHVIQTPAGRSYTAVFKHTLKIWDLWNSSNHLPWHQNQKKVVGVIRFYDVVSLSLFDELLKKIFWRQSQSWKEMNDNQVEWATEHVSVPHRDIRGWSLGAGSMYMYSKWEKTVI